MKSNESDTFFFFNKRWNRLPGTMIGHAGMFRFTNRFESKQTDKYDVYAGDGYRGHRFSTAFPKITLSTRISENLFLRDSLIYDFENAWKCGGVSWNVLFLDNRERRKSFILFFFYFKRLSIFRININAHLCEIYPKLSTSHQILKFNRILRIFVENQRFQFIISKHEEKEKREEKKKERKKEREECLSRKIFPNEINH